MSGSLLSAAFRTILANSRSLIFVKDTDFKYAAASEAFVALTGCENIVGLDDGQLFPAETADRLREADKKLLAGGADMTGLGEQLPDSAGGSRSFMADKHIIRDEQGTVIGILGILRPLSGEQLYHKERHLQMALKNMAVTVWEYDAASGTLSRTNFRDDGSGEPDRLSGTPDSFIEREIIHPDSAEDLRSMIAGINNGAREGDGMLMMKNHSRNRYAYERVHFTAIPDETGRPGKAIIISEDVTEQLISQDLLLQEAEHDAMTGLLNHGYTLKHISEFLEGEGKSGTHALLWIDMDYFKSVNDTFGHLYGDDVIKKSADIIRSSFRASDIVGRVGGDEFIALMKNIPDRELVSRKADELTSALSFSCREGNKRVDLSASVGIAFYNGDGVSLTKLMADSDAALYKAKAAGRNRYAVADESMN